MARGYPWAHDRVLRLRDEPIEVLDISQPPAPKKKKNWCHRLKGDHQFELVEEVFWKDLFGGGFREYHCQACGKKRHESIPVTPQ